jgi:hypothetical protein
MRWNPGLLLAVTLFAGAFCAGNGFAEDAEKAAGPATTDNAAIEPYLRITRTDAGLVGDVAPVADYPKQVTG